MKNYSCSASLRVAVRVGVEPYANVISTPCFSYLVGSDRPPLMKSIHMGIQHPILLGMSGLPARPVSNKHLHL